MAESKVILVTGATGKQGGSVIDNLLNHPAGPNFTILAVTRNTESPSAKKVAAKSSSIKLVQGDFKDVPALFKSAADAIGPKQSIWGVFSVQNPWDAKQSTDLEVTYGKAMVDGALENGVKFFVYTSVDRGGDEKSWTSPTNIPHFKSKHDIEIYLRDRSKADGGKMGWAILRPTAFYENIQPGFQTKVFMAAWRDVVGDENKVQFISTSDIGWFGAKAFVEPEAWNGKALALAGDDLNRKDIDAAIKAHSGSPLGATFSLLGSALTYFMADMGIMMKWFASDGYGADIPALRKMNPSLLTFDKWLETKSPFPKK